MNDIQNAMGGAAFVPGNVPNAATGFEPIPPGWYPIMIEKAEVRDTKAGTGKYLWMETTVVGENFANRKLFPTITIQNPNQMAVEIGHRELAALGMACGLNAITSSDELLGKTVQAKVKIKKEKGYDPDNEVNGWKPLDGAAPAPTAPATTTAAPATAAPAVTATQPAATGAGKMPWE